MVLKALVKNIFDKSKIEVVGNPTITEDGVASGFSLNDRVETIILNTSKKITDK